jgi:tetratricopeptide (TPR) repeat protein
MLLLADAGQSTPARARALHAAGLLAAMLGDVEAGRARLLESIAIWRIVGDPWRLGWTLHSLGRVLRADPVAARAVGEEAVALLRTAGDDWSLATALASLGGTLVLLEDAEALGRAHAVLEESLALVAAGGHTEQSGLPFLQLGRLARRRGDYATARHRFEESLAAFKANGAEVGPALVLGELGWLAQAQGEAEPARRYFHQSFVTAQRTNDRLSMGVALQGLAAVAVLQDHADRAVKLLGAAEALLTGREVVVFGVCVPFAAIVAAASAALGEQAFRVGWAAGRALTLDQALAEARAAAQQ